MSANFCTFFGVILDNFGHFVHSTINNGLESRIFSSCQTGLILENIHFIFDCSHKFTEIASKVNPQRGGYHRVNFDWIFSPLGVKGLTNTDDVFFQGLTSIFRTERRGQLYSLNNPVTFL
jgi:hypothetical protein